LTSPMTGGIHLREERLRSGGQRRV
jgi:hypothetical protein